MTLEEFKAYYKERYGTEGLARLQDRLLRVEQSGTSDRLDRRPVKEWVSFNRAGENESQLTYEEIVKHYVGPK